MMTVGLTIPPVLWKLFSWSRFVRDRDMNFSEFESES
uniref:Uncharacterized protein n=1 Tax=Anguilla anguilla TaxID=7936 RepID=A0A0E9Q8N5_ANGAN